MIRSLSDIDFLNKIGNLSFYLLLIFRFLDIVKLCVDD